MRFLLLLAGWLLPLAVHAAASYQLLTPRSISVAGGESQDVAIRFFAANGAPAAGEPVAFSNDACGVFANGQFFANTVTDAQGVASVRFTASNPPGITCWITISAGVTAIVDVLTYRLSEVGMQLTTFPAEPRLGEPYVLRVKPAYGIYGLDNVDIVARVIPGTSNASLSGSAVSTGEEGFAEFRVTPEDRIGDYAIEASFRTRKATLAMDAPPNPWQDMWWAGESEDGWGMSVVQHRDQLFAVIYAYDDAGRPTWFVVSGGTWNAAHTEFTGLAYVPTGSPFHSYDPARFIVGPAVGTLRLAFNGTGQATLDYRLLGREGTKQLRRHVFGPAEVSPLKGLGDMWWGGAAQAGWGLAVLQQSATLFCVWFTYDAAGAPTWYVMPAGSWVDPQTYAGRIYRATSSPWLGVPYDDSKFRTSDVGSFRLRFAGDIATLEWTLEGRNGMQALARMPF